MNLERMKQAAIAERKENDKWAVVCTDGDFQYARTASEARGILYTMMDKRDTVDPTSLDYGLVRVDV